MKKDIHPDYVDCTVTCTCGNTFQTRSTKPELRVDICNACHPFFTGTQKLIDSGGRVQRFANKFGTATETVAAREAAKKAERAAEVEAMEAAKKADREAKAAAKAQRAAEYAKKAAAQEAARSPVAHPRTYPYDNIFVRGVKRKRVARWGSLPFCFVRSCVVHSRFSLSYKRFTALW